MLEGSLVVVAVGGGAGNSGPYAVPYGGGRAESRAGAGDDGGAGGAELLGFEHGPAIVGVVDGAVEDVGGSDTGGLGIDREGGIDHGVSPLG